MKGVIFDFNGTMFYDELFQEESWRSFLKQKTGRDITDEEFQEYVHGRNAEATLSYFLQRECSHTELMELEEEKETIYRKLCMESEQFHLAEGLPQFLDELKMHNFPFTIATASSLQNVNFFFDHLNLGKWFDPDQVVYNDGTIPGKPEPDLYLRAAKLLSVEISDCVVFEDASTGIEAAKRAGAGKIVGVASMLEENELRSFGVSTTIKDYKDGSALFDFIMDETV